MKAPYPKRKLASNPNAKAPPARVEELSVAERINILGRHRNEILRKLERGENLDGVAADITNVTLQAIVDIMPSAEAAAKESSRGIYPLVNLTNLLRELTHDLRSMQDRNAMRQRIMSEIIDPSLLKFAQAQVTSLTKLITYIPPEDIDLRNLIAEMRERVAVTVNEMHILVSNSLDKYFKGSGGATEIMEVRAVDDTYQVNDGRMFER